MPYAGIVPGHKGMVEKERVVKAKLHPLQRMIVASNSKLTMLDKVELHTNPRVYTRYRWSSSSATTRWLA